MVLADLSASFDPLCPVTFRFERLEVNPRFATISRLSNAAVLARLRIDMEDRGGRIELLLPYATLEPVRELLLQQFMGEKFGRDSIWETHLAEELWNTDVELDVVLDEQMMPLADVIALQPGSRIVLGAAPGAPVAAALRRGAAVRGAGGTAQEPRRGADRARPAARGRRSARDGRCAMAAGTGAGRAAGRDPVPCAAAGTRARRAEARPRGAGGAGGGLQRQHAAGRIRASSGCATRPTAPGATSPASSSRCAGQKDDLGFLIERGDALADRLDALVRAARPLAGARPGGELRLATPPVPAEAAAEAPPLRSQAERDLMQALRLAR